MLTQPLLPSRKRLESLILQNHRHSPYELFRLFLVTTVNEFHGRATPQVTGELSDVIGQILLDYLALVRESEPLTDLLGKLYMEVASRAGRSQMGQFFTPQCIADMMAAMTYSQPLSPKQNGDLYRVIDPACGSGVMLLSTARQIIALQGKGALRDWSLSGVDLDYLCARMTAVQLLSNTMIHQLDFGEIWVAEGNSLGDPADLAVLVHATHSEANPEQVVPSMHPTRLAEVKRAAKSQMSVGEQLAFAF